MGAAIAAGSQEENGTWALLVIAANISIIAVIRGRVFDVVSTFHWFENKTIAIERRIRTSPIRLVRAVIMPAANDLLF